MPFDVRGDRSASRTITLSKPKIPKKPLSPHPVPREELLHRGDAGFGLLDLEKMRSSWNCLIGNRKLLGDRLTDERGRPRVFQIRIATHDHQRRLHLANPRPQRRIAIFIEYAGLERAWTCENPVPRRGILAQRRARDQRVRLGPPARKAAIARELAREVVGSFVALGPTQRARREVHLVVLLRLAERM